MLLKRRAVVAAGYMPLDVVLHGPHVSHAAGGTAGNVAAILAFLGWESCLVGETGNDPAGLAIREDLARFGVSADHLATGDGATARVVHRTGAIGHKFEFSCPVCGVKFPQNRRLTVGRADELARMLDPPPVFFFDRANHGTIRLAEHFAACGSQIVFEPAFGVDKPLARQAIAVADVVKVSAETTAAGRDALEGRVGQVQIVTYGSEGAEHREGTGPWRRSPAFDSSPIIDAAGAGDWTTAGFLDAASRGSDGQISTALAWGQAAATVSCGFGGARGIAYSQSSETLRRTVQHVIDNRARPCLAADEPVIPRFSADDACPTCLERFPIETKL